MPACAFCPDRPKSGKTIEMNALWAIDGKPIAGKK
jgi:hypothetical protein